MLERLRMERQQAISQASQSWRLSPFSFPYLNLTQPGFALGYRFDIVLGGAAQTPWEQL